MITIDAKDLDDLKRSLDGVAKKLPREISIAINTTSKKTKVKMAQGVKKNLSAPAKVIKKQISITRKASIDRLASTVELRESSRISLKEFRARQTRKGVSYKVSPKGGTRSIPGAFIVKRLGGHVYKRQGKSRLPIKKLFGPSPWGVFVGQRLRQPTKQESLEELQKQVHRRIRFNLLKKQGLI